MDDRNATFETIYRQFHQRVHHYMARLVSPGEAEDLTQEVFAKVAGGLATFEGRSRLSTWIYRIATNTALDRHRRKQSAQPTGIVPDNLGAVEPTEGAGPQESCKEGPLHQVIHFEMNTCIREQVDKLPEKYRTVMVLSSLEELDNREIAAILEISVDAVKIRLHRARAMLKKILEIQCRFYHNPASGALACDRKIPPRS